MDSTFLLCAMATFMFQTGTQIYMIYNRLFFVSSFVTFKSFHLIVVWEQVVEGIPLSSTIVLY